MNNWLAAEQDRVTRQLREGLTANGCVALIGEYRMGKTWALQSLQDSLPAPCAYLSLADVSTSSTETPDGRFYLRVLATLHDQSPQPLAAAPQAVPDTCQSPWDRYDWFVDSLRKFSTRPTTLLLDDVHLLAGSAWGAQLFRQLPNLMNRVNNLRIVVAGTSQLELWAMRLERNAGRAGIWDLIRAPIVLGSVSLQAIQDAFLDHPEVAQELIYWCGGHPYCLRQLTAAMPASVLRTSAMMQVLKDKMAQLQSDWDRTFRQYWQEYAAPVRRVCFVLTVLPDGATAEQLQQGLPGTSVADLDDMLDTLRDTGTIYLDPASKTWRLIGLFRQWYIDETGYLPGAGSIAQGGARTAGVTDEAAPAAATAMSQIETETGAEMQPAGSPGRLTAGAIQRLKEQLVELENRRSTLSKRIQALDTDIGRTTEKLARDVRQEMRDELEQERNEIAEKMTSIESRLNA